MLRFLLLFILLGLVFFLLYQNIHYPHLRQNPISERILAPFDQRIRYRIGEIDPRFAIHPSEVQQLALEATQIWQQAGGKDYFVYDPKAKLTIDLIYDERQLESNSRQQQLEYIESRQALWQQRHLQAEQLKQHIQALQQQLSQKRDDLNQATHLYNQQVQHLNARGGASAEQRFALQDQKLHLQQQQQRLTDQIATHNQKIQILNQEVSELNTLNAELSQEVSGFNARFSGKKFDKGLFNGRQIAIYEFSSKDDLRLTLAHEFGHALGLPHHDDPYGLMHPILQKQDATNFQLSPADLKLLLKQ